MMKKRKTENIQHPAIKRHNTYGSADAYGFIDETIAQ